MSGTTKTFNLPWHQHERYRIAVLPHKSFSPSLIKALQAAGCASADGNTMAAVTPRQWKPVWDRLYATLDKAQALAEVDIAIGPDGAQAERRTPVAVATLADNLWLGDALLDGRLMCYLQPVIDARGQTFGYESFARVRSLDGGIIAGDRIIAASRVLGIEYAIDRHLHIEAIKTFVSSGFGGFLFVNLCPGFIHRPAVYLEGLSDSAREYGIVAKHVVLDFTNAEQPRDMDHLLGICDYARSRGYSIALDDIGTLAGAIKLLDVRPDFVKLDAHLVQRAEDAQARDTIRQIVELVHAIGGSVIAEGVETEAVHKALKALRADLFQGYLFSPPLPVETALRRSGGAA